MRGYEARLPLTISSAPGSPNPDVVEIAVSDGKQGLYIRMSRMAQGRLLSEDQATVRKSGGGRLPARRRFLGLCPTVDVTGEKVCYRQLCWVLCPALHGKLLRFVHITVRSHEVQIYLRCFSQVA